MQEFPNVNHSPPPAAALHDIDEIDQRMATDGFPELQKLWKRFRRGGKSLADLRPEEMTAREDRHMRPLFGGPFVVGVLLTASSFVATYWVAPIEPFRRGFPNPYFLAFALGLIFLGVMALTFVQRYWCYPFDDLLAERIAWLLAHHDFRESHGGAPRTIAATDQLQGVQGWDDPDYRAAYRWTEGRAVPQEESSANAYVLAVVRDFVGRKNPDTRKFEPGRFFQALQGGKKTVSAFVQRRRETIDALKQNAASLEAMQAALADLAEFVSSNSKAGGALREAQTAIQAEVFTPPGCYRAEIWRRDPWVDLTHQNEFFSSSGLRGVKWVGRGPKGRLAPVIYLDDPALSCLDLRERSGRLARCRLLAVFLGNEPCLFVDGVEGSNQAAPAVIRRAIEDYARRCGFAEVLFNANVHNRTPRRFVRYLARDLKLQAVRIRAVDRSRRQYLDAFSWPLEPLEYVRSEGVVLAYCSKDHPGRRLLLWKALHGLRMNILNLTAIVAVGGAITNALIYAPWFLVALAAVTIPLWILHFQSR